jgi:hypothetical protein
MRTANVCGGSEALSRVAPADDRLELDQDTRASGPGGLTLSRQESHGEPGVCVPRIGRSVSRRR